MYILLLLFRCDMFRLFFWPLSGGGYKYMMESFAVKEASSSQSTC